MSLVNDMLRDLDARRRDAPAGGIGAEKLVPAAEQVPPSERRQTPAWLWLMLGVLLVVTGLIVAYVLLARDSGQLPAVVLTQPAVPAAQPAATDRAASTNENPALSQAVGIELAEMSARMRELEAQNQALLRAQQTQSSAPTAGSPSGSMQAGSLPAGSDASGETTWQPRQWTPQADVETAPAAAEAAQSAQPAPADNARTGVANAPVREPQTQQAPEQQSELTQQQQSSTAEPASATVRSPRELSFADTDRLRVQQALEQWNGGQQLAALQALDTFTYEYPEAHQSREMLAKLLIQQGEPERAMQVVDLGLTIAPRRNGYRKVKARLLLNQGQPAEAAALLSSGAPSVSDDVEFHDLLATGLLSSAAYGDAAVTYQALLETDEQPGRWWYGLAASLDAQGRSRDAMQAYEQALRREDLSAALRQGSQQRLQAIRQAQP